MPFPSPQAVLATLPADAGRVVTALIEGLPRPDGLVATVDPAAAVSLVQTAFSSPDAPTGTPDAEVRRRVAIHEAAHAVAALALGLSPLRIELSATERNGHVRLDPLPRVPMSERAQFERRLAVLQAGSVAEFGVFGDLYSNDAAQVLLALGEHRPHWTPARRGRTLIRCAARAWQIFTRHEASIHRLAQALESRHSIDGTDAIAAGAGWPLPRQASTASATG